MTLEIQKKKGIPAIPVAQLRKIARKILEIRELSHAELSLLLTDDEEIRGLNLQWRGKDKATDVLSFAQDEGDMPFAIEGLPQLFLGDIVISTQTALRQAEDYQATLEEELRRLLVHGILHLLGYEHVHGGRQARKMKDEEERILRLLDELPLA
ncbi:rRNA maturation RNase YbeY [Myxococcota bacterium]|nr:rRNA maturation RNase YbeY [Myxococcota bacterium]